MSSGESRIWGSKHTETAGASSASASASGATRATDRAAGNTTTEALTRVAAELRFDLLRNSAYHNDELLFYSAIHRLAMFLSVLAGTATVGTLALVFVPSLQPQQASLLPFSPPLIWCWI